MGLLKWVERKAFTGDVIQDYGCFHDVNYGIAKLRVSVLLCRRKGKLEIVVRESGTSPFSASVRYSYIDVTPENVTRLWSLLADAKRCLETPTPPKII